MNFRVTVLIISLFLGFNLNAKTKDLKLKRLEKLYHSDKDKCLEVTRNIIRNHPEIPAPYYFATALFEEQLHEKEKTRDRYYTLRKVLVYAKTFNRLARKELKAKVSWNKMEDKIKSSSIMILNELNSPKEMAMRSRLYKRTAKYFGTDFYTVATDKIESEKKELTTTKEEKTKLETSNFLNGEYFGKPTGNEHIESYDLKSETEVLELLNKARIKKGLKPLVWNENLARAARYHAYDMATQDYFHHATHDREYGKEKIVFGTFNRIETFYTEGNAHAENIAAGSSSANGAYKQWYESKGHYKNMFSDKAKEVGIGVYYYPNSTYGYYWVLNTGY